MMRLGFGLEALIEPVWQVLDGDGRHEGNQNASDLLLIVGGRSMAVNPSDHPGCSPIERDS
jgi:hypothetical protein